MSQDSSAVGNVDRISRIRKLSPVGQLAILGNKCLSFAVDLDPKEEIPPDPKTEAILLD